MDLSDLHIFRTVVEQGGIVKAAQKLHRVPSNVTTRIRQLEASIGAPLFHRDRQRLVLSAGGARLMPYAEQLLRLSEEAHSAVAGRAPRGLLRLGSLESTAASRLPPTLAAYHRQYPEVRVELSTGTNDALTVAVLERRLDAAFVAETPAHAALAHQPLFTERLVLISARSHRKVASPADVEGDSLIAFSNGCAYRRRLQEWLGDAARGLRVLDLGSYHAIVACVAAGAGVALVPVSVLDGAPGAAQVKRHPLPPAIGKVVTPLIWRAEAQPPSLVALRELLSARPEPARASAPAAG